MVRSQHLKGAGGVAFSEFKGLSQWRICASAGGAGVGASSSLFRRSGFAPALKQQVLFDKTVQWSKKKGRVLVVISTIVCKIQGVAEKSFLCYVLNPT